MKFFLAILLVAFAAVALADKPEDVESIEPTNVETKSQVAENAARDKRGLLVGAAYTAPVAYAAPVAYSASYSLPYAAVSPYRAYPYAYSAYSVPYIYG